MQTHRDPSASLPVQVDINRSLREGGTAHEARRAVALARHAGRQLLLVLAVLLPSLRCCPRCAAVAAAAAAAAAAVAVHSSCHVFHPTMQPGSPVSPPSGLVDLVTDTALLIITLFVPTLLPLQPGNRPGTQPLA